MYIYIYIYISNLTLYWQGRVKPKDGELNRDIIIFDVLANKDDIQVSNIVTKNWVTSVESNSRNREFKNDVLYERHNELPMMIEYSRTPKRKWCKF